MTPKKTGSTLALVARAIAGLSLFCGGVAALMYLTHVGNRVITVILPEALGWCGRDPAFYVAGCIGYVIVVCVSFALVVVSLMVAIPDSAADGVRVPRS